MKHFVFLALAGFFAFSTAVGAQDEPLDDVFPEPVITPSLKFSAVLQADGSVLTGWNEWDEDFMWYKLVRSQEDPDPMYPEHGHIFFSTERSTTSYTDTDVPLGKSFYRICVITHANERFCSNVVAVDTENNDVTGAAASGEPVRFCAQVEAPARNPDTDECRNFPTPCDVPEGWESIDSCPADRRCKTGSFAAIEPKTLQCVMAVDTCEIPNGWLLLPDGQACPSGSDFPLQVIRSEAGVLLLWDHENEAGTLYRVFRRNVDAGPEAGFDAIADSDGTTYEDTDVVVQGRYSYRVCLLAGGACSEASIIQEVTVTDEPAAEADPAQPQVGFSDVSAGTETGQAILGFAETGVINGFTDGTFRPEKAITRAELAKVAILATENDVAPGGVESRFCDVPADEWFAPYVDFFVTNGYANGFRGGDCTQNAEFRPHEPVRRSEAVKMIFEIAGIEVELLSQGAASSFADVPASHWFLPYAKAISASGVLEGVVTASFRPDAPATRAEVMLFLRRAIDYAASAEAPPKIVEHFACGDYCPGDPQQYTVKIYEGVKAEEECKRWNGSLYTYIGWTETTVCLAEGEQVPTAPPVESEQEVPYTGTQDEPVVCDALNPCASGECYLLPEATTPVCVDTASTDICAACESGECVSLGSYPVQIRCAE